MRTLKKTLALVLVLAMMFSLCAVSASADFTDADEINYTEAADVMAMIGVIEGMPDGSFDAKGTLTRAQAAVMITRLLGAEDYAVATAGEFADVAANHWAAGAISFCVEAGIVEGYGDGNFGPSDTLTGYQWAKMLLCALGYNAKAEGMSGAAWQINVAKLAKAEKLFAGNDKADKTVAATREEAALYALNLLSATIVEYKGGSSVTVGDITFTSGGELKDTEKTFMSEYFKKLSCQKGEGYNADDFGRPGYTWVLTGLKPADTQYVWVGEEAMATYEGLEWNAKEKAALEKALYKFDTADVVYNGSAFALADTYNKLGMTVELYADLLGNITDVVAYEPYAAKVTDVKTAKDGTVTVYIDVYEAGYYLANSKTYAKIEIDSVSEKEDYALVKDLVKDDIFVAYFGQGWETSEDILAVDSFETVTGKVTAISADEYYNGWVKIDGEQKYFANEYSQAAVKVGSEGTFYVYNGYVMHFVATKEAAPQYAYLLDYADATDMWGTATRKAKLVYTDATTAEVIVAADYTALEGTMVTYKDGTGADAGKVVLASAGAWQSSGDLKIVNNKAVQAGDTYNDKTVFVIETTDATTKLPVYTAYTGITAIPTVTGEVNVIIGSISKAVEVCFIMSGELEVAPVETKDVTYIGSKVADIKEDINKVEVSYSVYNAIVNGEITTVKSTVELTEGYYAAFTYDANGMINGKTALVDNETTKVDVLAQVTVTAAAKDGVIMGSLYNDKTAVYAIDADTNAITESTIGAIEATDTYLAYTTNGTLTMVVYRDISK